MHVTTSLGMAAVLQDGMRDTVVMIAADRGVMETIAVTGQFIVSLIVLILLGALVFMLIAIRKSVQELTKLLHSSYGDISAAAHSVRNVAEDVRGITQNVKTEFGAVSDTIHDVNRGVRRAVRRAELRMKRLDALVGVAQEEAEELVMSSASALRGVRFGAAALKRSFLFSRHSNAKRKKRRTFRDERPRGKRTGERPRIRTRVVEPT